MTTLPSSYKCYCTLPLGLPGGMTVLPFFPLFLFLCVARPYRTCYFACTRIYSFAMHINHIFLLLPHILHDHLVFLLLPLLFNPLYLLPLFFIFIICSYSFSPPLSHHLHICIVENKLKEQLEADRQHGEALTSTASW